MNPIENGGVTDKYSWSQNFKDMVSIHIKVDKETKSKDIKIDLTNSNIRATLKGKVILEGELYNTIKISETTWYLENNSVVIELDKYNKGEWWKSVFKGEKEIDISKNISEVLVSDLDSKTAMDLDKLQNKIIDVRNKMKI